MTEKKAPSPLKPAAEQRRQRLARALRDNLRWRKQRQAGAGPSDPPDGATGTNRGGGAGRGGTE